MVENKKTASVTQTVTEAVCTLSRRCVAEVRALNPSFVASVILFLLLPICRMLNRIRFTPSVSGCGVSDTTTITARRKPVKPLRRCFFSFPAIIRFYESGNKTDAVLLPEKSSRPDLDRASRGGYSSGVGGRRSPRKRTAVAEKFGKKVLTAP
jgi:hypothetical protein